MNKKDKKLANQKYYQENKDKIQTLNHEYYQKNKTALSEYQHKYYLENRDARLGYRHKYDQENKGAISEKKRRYYEEHKDQKRNTQLLNTYGITLEDYETMLKQQEGRCAICKNKPNKKSLSVDHNHDTGKIRGLLCNNCNQGLGRFQDNPEILQIASAYLNQVGNEDDTV